MDAVKVSVIMGIYNSDRNKLSQAIDSILNQTFDDFEFIICDDGSTNDIVNYLKKNYTDYRLKIIQNNKNSGLAYSLNHCLNEARGGYIARMDDDDISERTRLEKQVMFLDNHPEYGIVGTAIWLSDDSGVWGEKFFSEKPCKEDLLFGVVHAHPTIMVRKEVYDSVGGYRSIPKTRRTEDYDLYLRIYATGVKGYNLQEKLFYYTQSMQTLGKRKFKHRIDEVSVRFEGFKKLGLMPKGLLYCLKPILSGLVPNGIKQKRLHKMCRKK